MKPFGISLALIGAVVVAVAFFLMPSTVSTEEMTSLPYTGAIVGSGHFTETYNMPRAQLRDMVAQLGEVLFLGGCILFVGGVLDERLRGGAAVAPAYPGDPEVQGDADSYAAAAGLAEAERNKRIVAGAIVAGVVILTIVGVIGASNSNRISGASSPDAAESSSAQSAAENASHAADEAMNAAMNAADNAAAAAAAR